ncbi:methylthioribulose 1-phosphate dehydratase [Lusitaniella coriacea LEGE 07157]|uniref:Methylthioribulose-1-phosphate dehydratase n=1 Tax=Lusitaniella coriacea LEGE 07157 TaxID=945747 RepID=A0A8J7DUT5_9CYAN|nr:methylthioribulose 1-phosphate dehydratase [Lusitaniella coriacea]MBE9114395.1 methylthioribulose 1-phosphate dehydratase [Lusitaniella coriacea LEGE 07157]
MTSDPRSAVIAAARQFYQLGWMVGTAGNLSVRLEDSSFWITASGKQKGDLRDRDFVRINPNGTVIESPNPNNRPSAETSIHQTIYDLFPDVCACYHVHSVEANIAANFSRDGYLPLPPLEMIKGLGIWQENPEVKIPVFENHLAVRDIATEVRDRFQAAPPDIPALLIRNHGVTVWGSSPTVAQNYLEIAEYLFRYLVVARQIT